MLPGQFEIQKSILEFREAGFTYQQIRQVFPALTGDNKKQQNGISAIWYFPIE